MVNTPPNNRQAEQESTESKNLSTYDMKSKTLDAQDEEFQEREDGRNSSGSVVFSLRIPAKKMEILEEMAVIAYQQGVIEKPVVASFIRWNTDLLIKESIKQGKVKVAMRLKEHFERRVKMSTREALIDAILKSRRFDEILDANTAY